MKDWHNTVCLDFDGVISQFGGDSIAPVEGMVEGVKGLIGAGWYIDIYSGRSRTLSGITYMREWFHAYAPALEEYFGHEGKIQFPRSKPIAKVYIDDRGLKFESWADITPEVLENFRTWWQHPASTK